MQYLVCRLVRIMAERGRILHLDCQVGNVQSGLLKLDIATAIGITLDLKIAVQVAWPLNCQLAVCTVELRRDDC